MLTPYLLYLKIGAVLAVLIACFWVYSYINSAFEERDQLRISDAKNAALVDQYQKSMTRDSQVRESINEAISKIRVTSNVNVSKIYSDPPPTAPDGVVIRLFNGGVPTKDGMPTFTNNTSNSSATTP